LCQRRGPIDLHYCTIALSDLRDLIFLEFWCAVIFQLATGREEQTMQKNNSSVFPLDRVYEVIDGRQAVAAHGPGDMPVWGDVYSARGAAFSFGYANPKGLESFTRGRIIALIGYIYTLQAK
jgi:hypothetical protein